MATSVKDVPTSPRWSQSLSINWLKASQCYSMLNLGWHRVIERTIWESHGRIATCGELFSPWLGGQQLNCRRLRFRKEKSCISLGEIQRVLARVVQVNQVLATRSTFEHIECCRSEDLKATGFRATRNDTQCPNVATPHLCGSGAPGWGPRVPQARRLAARFWYRIEISSHITHTHITHHNACMRLLIALLSSTDDKSM